MDNPTALRDEALAIFEMLSEEEQVMALDLIRFLSLPE